MGFNAGQWWRQERPRGLQTAQICIMWEAVWSCRDDDGCLRRSRSWLAEGSGLGIRSLERHLPVLSGLELLAWNGEHFRLPAYIAWYQSGRQIGGGAFELTANLSANLRKEKERTKEKESTGKDFLGITPPVSPSKIALEMEAADAFIQALDHYREWSCPFQGWKYGAPELDPDIANAVRLAGGFKQLAALSANPREYSFFRRDFMRFFKARKEVPK